MTSPSRTNPRRSVASIPPKAPWKECLAAMAAIGGAAPDPRVQLAALAFLAIVAIVAVLGSR